MKTGMNRLGALGLLALLLPACGGNGAGTLTQTVAPGIPANVAARAGNRSVTIDWTESAQGAEYTVQRSLLPKGPFFPVSVPQQFPFPTRYVDPGLTNGTTYYYQVVAVNAFGPSAPSAAVSGTPGFKAVAVSARLAATNLALLRDGSVWQWGPNNSEQIMDAPVQIPNLPDITAISCGLSHSLALASDGRVWSWGGLLGISLTEVPVQVLELTDVIAVASGGSFSLAVTQDGTVQVWGGNGDGELGTGSTSPADSPTPIPVPGLTNIVAVEGGYAHCIALRSDGLVFTWGANYLGQCGRGSTSSAPLAVGQVPGLTGIVAISAGYEYCLALRNDGTVWGWGDNGYAQLGIGSHGAEVSTPTQTVGLAGVTSIAAGTYHSLAVLNDGTLCSWGFNYFGALGNGPADYTYADSPLQVLGISNVVAATASYANSVGLTVDGTVYSWGDNTQGELGNGTGPKTHVPTELKNVTGTLAIAAGMDFSLVARVPGTVWGIGAAYQGQLGNGSASGSPPSDPVQATVVATATSVAAGALHALALDANTGTVWGWGANDSGQVGNGTTGVMVFDPALLTTPSGITVITCGGYHSLAIRNDQTLWSWGNNVYFQLGRPITGSGDLSPGQVSGLTGVVSAAGAQVHSAAVKSDGTVWVWGDNSIGELGLGGTGPEVATPTQVPGITGAIAVAAGSYHTLVLLSDGTLLAWGRGDRGQLGNGYVDSWTPIPVLGLTGVTAIAAGSEYSMALKSDGTIVSWGSNGFSQLGNPVFGFTSTPTAVQGLTNVVAIAGGYTHSMALLSNGTVWLWGANESNQLGVRYVEISITPVIISH